jgi:hypothetical protein
LAQAGLVLALTLQAPAAARAYTYASPLADGCHEAISIAALRDARANGAAATWPARDHDRAWIDDLPLELPRDARDLAAASLVVGVRDNDLKGRHGLDTSELPLVHGNPAAQIEHCLRRPEHDEPDGSEAALQECRAFIRDKIADALGNGLDGRGRPDPNARIDVDVDLAFGGETRVPMPRFYVQLGRALHTLQDSFSHALRSEDALRVRALLNWVDFVGENHAEARDGPAHRAELDHCDDLDDVRALRLQRATQASSELLSAALDPLRDPAARLDAVDDVLDRYMSFEPGCSAEDDFCAAPELAYAETDAGCAAAPGSARAQWPALAWLLIAAVACVRWRRAGFARALVVGAALLLPLAAAAQPHAPQATDSGPRAASAAPTAAATPPSPFALAAELGAAVDQASAAAAAGVRYRADERWLLGVDVEWNPWASLETARVRAGTFNAFATAIWRAPLTRDVALRIAGHLGASLLLFDLYGAPSGSVGPYVGLSLLALELGLSRNLTLVLEPADVVVAIPHVTGIPLTRRQYRASIGLEWWL